MSRLIAAIANGGTLYRPRIAERIAAIGREPEVILEPGKVGRLPITPATMDAIRTGLDGATMPPLGTATHRFVGFPIPVAGKTGTAQNEGEVPHAWFIGYLPADEPEIAIAAMLENIGEGATYAARLFRQVAEAYFGREIELQPQAGDGNHGHVPHREWGRQVCGSGLVVGRRRHTPPNGVGADAPFGAFVRI